MKKGLSNITIFEDFFSDHPDQLISKSFELYGKAKFCISYDYTKMTNTNASIEIQKSDDGISWTTDTTKNLTVSESSFINLNGFNKGYLRVVYNATSIGRSKISIEINF
jgi:hypothetical protein